MKAKLDYNSALPWILCLNGVLTENLSVMCTTCSLSAGRCMLLLNEWGVAAAVLQTPRFSKRMDGLVSWPASCSVNILPLFWQVDHVSEPILSLSISVSCTCRVNLLWTKRAW
jgi:hypothetical protein